MAKLHIRKCSALACCFAALVNVEVRAQGSNASEENRAIIEQQAEKIKELEEKVQRLEQATVERAQDESDDSGSPQNTEPAPPSIAMDGGEPIGDLNRFVSEGDFPGSILIPGPGKVSLAFGGFIKAYAWRDNNQEDGLNFLPAFLGVRNDDDAGQTKQSADLTRINLDLRAPTPNGAVRGFVEYDFNKNNDSGFNLRHAFLEWVDGKQQLIAGQTWSAFMDLAAVPEGIAEPTLSGGVFARQSQIRYRRSFTDAWEWTVSAEDPDSNDVFSERPANGRTKIPDLITTIKYGSAGTGHIQLGGLYRRIEGDAPTGESDDASAWGLSATGRLQMTNKDSVYAGYIYGEGVGRYLLGLTSASAGFVTDDDQLRLRDNTGVYIGHARRWNDSIRTNIAFGQAKDKNYGADAPDTFRKSEFLLVNAIYQFTDYLSIGVEYNYGKRTNNDGSDIDNNRIGIAFQLF